MANSENSSVFGGDLECRKGKGFTNKEDAELIEFVSNYKILWKLNHPDYKSNLKKDVIWNEIGLQLNKKGEQCKVRWRSIRDNFKRHKKMEATGTGQPAKKKRAMYWNRLRFLNDVEDERQEFTNTQEPSCSTIDGAIEQESYDTSLEEDNVVNVKSLSSNDDVNPSTSAKYIQSSSSSTGEQTTPKINKKPKGNNSLISLIKRRAEDQCNLAKVIEKMASEEVPMKQEDDIDVFMHSMALTIKKFTPAEQCEAKRKIFRIVNELEDRHYARANTLETFGYSRTPSSLSYESSDDGV